MSFMCNCTRTAFKMPLINLAVSIKSYWVAKRFNTVYFDCFTLDNLIFDNKLIEEKNTRVKINFNSDKRNEILANLHNDNNDWKLSFEIDPTCATIAKDNNGNKITSFKSQNAYTDC